MFTVYTDRNLQNTRQGRRVGLETRHISSQVCYYYFIIFYILLILFYCCTRSKRGMGRLRGGGNDESGPKWRVLRRLGIGKFFLSCFIYTNQCFFVYIDCNLQITQQGARWRWRRRESAQMTHWRVVWDIDKFFFLPLYFINTNFCI